MSAHPSILIVAGEASGDRHAARVAAGIRRARPDVRLFGIGGQMLRAEGMEILADASQMNVVGFVEVVKRYGFFRSVLHRIINEARARRPVVAILVDYPGFNLRLARLLHQAGIRVVWYIAPQVWAWKEGRVAALRSYVDDLIVAFPFEVEYFARHGITASFYGHPLIDQRAELLGSAPASAPGAPPSIAYLPGSRPEEIARHMPVLVEVMRDIGPGYRHVIPKASTIELSLFDQYRGRAEFEIVGSAYEALSGASAALVKSGTSTLDATLLGVPFAVFYRTSNLSYQIARRMITVQHIAMPNVLAGRRVVHEYVQDAMNANALLAELRELLENTGRRQELLAELGAITASLGQPGAAARVADHIVKRYLP